MKKLLGRAAAAVKKVVNRGRVLHYVDIFAGAFGMALWFDRAHLLAAHGMNAVGCVVFAAAVTGAKATLEAFRKSTPTPAVSAAVDAAEHELAAAAAKVAKPAS